MAAVRSGRYAISLELKLDASAERLLFSRGDQNRMERFALHTAGADWIARHLAERFGPKALTLGYRAKKMDRDHTVVTEAVNFRMAMDDGTIDRLAAIWSRGWNPWRNPFPPDVLLKGYIAFMQRSEGRFRVTRTGEWKTARRELRKTTKAVLLGKLKQLPHLELAAPLPLVNTGALRASALAGARADARATATRSSLKIVIPQPHPTAPIVSEVLRQLTAIELAQIEDLYGRTFAGLIFGAETGRVNRVGRISSRLTAAQRELAQLVSPNRRRQSAAISPTRSAGAKRGHETRRARQRPIPGGAPSPIPT